MAELADINGISAHSSAIEVSPSSEGEQSPPSNTLDVPRQHVPVSAAEAVLTSRLNNRLSRISRSISPGRRISPNKRLQVSDLADLAKRQRRRRTCRCCAACLFVLLPYATYAAVAAADLLSAGKCSGCFDLTHLNVSSLCSSEAEVVAAFDVSWKSFSGVSVESGTLTAYDESGVQLLEAELPAAAHVDSGVSELLVGALVRWTDDLDALAEATRRLLGSESSSLLVDVRLTASTGAFTGFSVSVPVAFELRLECERGSCTLDGDDEASGESEGANASLSLLEVALSSAAPASATADLRLALEQSEGPSLSATVPALALEGTWAADDASAATATAPISIAVAPAQLRPGRSELGVEARVSAASEAEGQALRSLAHAALAPGEAAPLRLYARQAAGGSASECFLHRYLAAVGAIEVAEVSSLASLLDGGGDGDGGDGGDDGGNDLTVEALTATLEGVDDRLVWARVLVEATAAFDVGGSTPPLQLSLEANGAEPSTLLSVAAPEVGLALPSVEAALSGVVEPAAGALAADVVPLLQARPVDRTALLGHIAGLTLGPVVSADSAAGLAALRLPLEWLLSPSMSEVLVGPSAGAEEVALVVDAVGATAELDYSALTAREAGAPEQAVALSLDASLQALPLPERVVLAVGAAALRLASGGGGEVGEAAVGALGLSSSPSAVSASATVRLGALLDAPEGSLALGALSVEGTLQLSAAADAHAHAGRGAVRLSGATLQAWADALSSADSVAARDLALELNVSQPYVSSCAAAAGAAHLPLDAPVALQLPPLGLEVRGAAAGALAAVDVAPLALAAGAGVSLAARFELLSAGARGAEAALQGLFEGGEAEAALRTLVGGGAEAEAGPLSLCVEGGAAAQPAAVRVCVEGLTAAAVLGERGATDGAGGLLGADATLDVLGGTAAELTLPCVLGASLCAEWSLAQARAEAARTLRLQLTLPPPAVPCAVRLGLPDVSLEAGYDGFLAVARLHVAARRLELAPGAAPPPLVLPFEASVADWYAASRLFARDGRGAAPSFALNTTLRLRGSRAAPIGACSRGLPALSRALPPSSANGSACLVPPTYLLDDPVASDPPKQPMTLVGTTATSAQLALPFSLCNPLPLVLRVPALSLTASFEGDRVATASLGALALAAGSTTALTVALSAHAGAPGAEWACVGAGLDAAAAESCALSRLLRSLSSFAPTALALRVDFANALGEARAVLLDATIWAEGERQDELHDRRAAFIRRGSAFFAAQDVTEASSMYASKQLLPELGLDIGATVWDSLFTLLTALDGSFASGRTVSAAIEFMLHNLYTVGISLHELQATSAELADIDGVGEHAPLIAISDADGFDPAAAYVLLPPPGLTEDLALAAWPPGADSPLLTTSIDVTWEGVVRYVDEMYARVQQCLAVPEALLEVEIRCDAAADCAAPMRTTFALALSDTAAFKRRACHRPLACAPATTALFAADEPRTAATTTTVGDAALSGGTIELVGGDGVARRGAAYHATRVALLAGGFEASFDFAIAACPPVQDCDWTGWFCDEVPCEDTDAAFAFVVQDEAADALGADCATEVQSFMYSYESDFYGVRLDNATRLACAAYEGVGRSFGLVFSTVRNRLYTFSSWSALSDWPRGALGLYVNGEMGVTTSTYGPARGVAQFAAAAQLDDGEHSARVVYSRAAEMLYAYVDGAQEPTLWAQLAPDELGLAADGAAWVGFTGTSGTRSQSISISNWRVSATVTSGADSTLLEAAAAVTSVGIGAAVHIDSRDSCGLPRHVGGDAWAAELRAPSGATVAADVADLGDGTYRVPVLPSEAGVHTLTATLGGEQFAASFIVDPDE